MKKSISILLALVLVLGMLLSACGSSETVSNTPAASGSSASSGSSSTPASSGSSETTAPAASDDEDEEEEEEWDEIVDLKLVLCSVGDKSGWADIQEKINEIAEKRPASTSTSSGSRSATGSRT